MDDERTDAQLIATTSVLLYTDRYRPHRNSEGAQMVSCAGKVLLVLTSLAPICGAFAINRIAESKNFSWVNDVYFWTWIIVATALVAVACLFLKWCREHLERLPFRTKQIKPTDKDVLAFLLAYLLPFLGKDAFIVEKPIISVYVYGLIFLAIYHSNSYHFNPMLSLFQYHFYDVTSEDGYSAMLISRKSHVNQQQEIHIVRITNFLMIEVSD